MMILCSDSSDDDSETKQELLRTVIGLFLISETVIAICLCLYVHSIEFQ
ncbi:hypothetical protein HanOQP8_Chr15g0583231 [Helianthus annuus]|nr:hypothetical protein HanOQP8_Chr15g0583231 [Helianthus annuus]